MLFNQQESYQQVINNMSSPFISILFNKAQQCSILILAPGEIL